MSRNANKWWPLALAALEAGLLSADAAAAGPTVRITEMPQVSQPPPFSKGRTVVVPRTRIEIDEAGAAYPGPRRRALRNALNLIGIGTPDLLVLARHYRDTARASDASRLFVRALAAMEATLGPDHAKVAAALDEYAALLRVARSEARARELEARAGAIRARHAEQNQAN